MKIKNYFWPLMLFLLIISAAVYLPLVASLGYFKDDWYLIYDAHSQGASFFHEIYRVDRPARGYFLQFIYSMFGDRVLLYHISAYLYRFLATAALFWALVKTFPRRTGPSFLVALLFLVYPGFLSQINPIDYQSQLMSLCLALISIALTVQAIHAENRALRIVYTLLSILTGLVYLPLVEYFIGFEALRLVLVATFVLRQKNGSIRTMIAPLLRVWLPFLSITAIFLVWRLFFFAAERRATDASVQLGQAFSSPSAILGWFIALLQDSIKAALLAWAVPVYNMAFNLRMRDFLAGLGISILVIGLTLLGLWLSRRESIAEGGQEASEIDWRLIFLFAGLIVVAAGLLPVILVNRRADFTDYSRYLLASAAGAAILITALLYYLEQKFIRTSLIILLMLGAVFTQYANAVQGALETRNMNDFWWQVTWRVPGIKPGTTLVADYPVGAIEEDYFVWGPANMIYQPGPQSLIPIEIKIPAAVLTDETVIQIMHGKGNETQLRRGNDVVRDFSNVLVLTQATPSGCVRVINGASPELSEKDQQRIMLVASASRIDDVLTSAPPPPAPTAFFGAEPPHGWCYYYQKAALARQQNDWKTVSNLGDKALAEGYYPSDKIEWMPFLQAYVTLGQKEKLHRFVSIMGESPFIQKQVCTALSAAAKDPDLLATVKEDFCQR